MDLSLVRQLALGVIPPALAAVVAFAALWWRHRAAPAGTGGSAPLEPCTRLQRIVPALLLGALYWPLHIALFGRIPMPPQSAFDWLRPLFLICGLATVLATLLPPARLRMGSLIAVTTALLVAGTWLSARSLIEHSWSAAESVLKLSVASLLGLVFVSGLLRLGSRAGPLPVAMIVLVLAAASQAMVLLFFSFKLGQVAGVAAAFAGGALIIALRRRSLRLGAPLVATAGTVVAVAVWQAVLFGEAERPVICGVIASLLPWMVLAVMALLRALAGRRATSRPARAGAPTAPVRTP